MPKKVRRSSERIMNSAAKGIRNGLLLFCHEWIFFSVKKKQSTEISVDCSAFDEFLGAHQRKERSEGKSYFISADR